jgi:ribonuclease D
MPYFTDPSEIRDLIADYSEMPVLWIDTEIADFTSPNPRLSLIQITHVDNDPSGLRTCVLDVLDHPDLIREFIDIIANNPHIEKIAHNLAFDRRFLGGDRLVNGTCTLKLARSFGKHVLPVKNHQLATLFAYFSHTELPKELSLSDWGKRPLSHSQLQYAYRDPAAVAIVHRELKKLLADRAIDPTSENIDTLAAQCYDLECIHAKLTAELEECRQRLKLALQTQSVDRTEYYILSHQQRVVKKVPFRALAETVLARQPNFDYEITLTKALQEQLGDCLNILPIETTIEELEILKLHRKYGGLNETQI